MLDREIATRYYETTAARGHSSELAEYETRAKALLRRLEPWLPNDRGVRCLDLACGCGEVMFMLERQGFRRTLGVDLCNAELLEGRRHVQGEFVHAEALAFARSLPDASFGLVTALNFLEHLPKDQGYLLLREVRRILRPGGALLLMVPNAVSPLGGISRYWDLTHQIAFTPNNFEQLAALVGFSPEVDFRECGPVPYGVVSGARYLAWRALRLGIKAWLMVEVANLRGGIYTLDMLVRLRRP